MDDTIINKASSIQRCIKRTKEEYTASENFETDFTRQDVAILNLTRACEQSIDLANHIIKKQKLGIPGSSGDSFHLLQTAGIIPKELTEKLIKMTGFRNTAVHMYQDLDIQIVISIIKTGLNDLERFSEIIVKFSGP